MKTILRSVNMAVLLTAIMAVGAVSGFAQDPIPNPACTDAAGITDLDAKWRAAWADKSLAGRKNFVDVGKQFLEKYGACDSQKESIDWLKTKVADTETKTIPEMIRVQVEQALVARFDNGLKAKNWDEVYAAGKEILAKYPGKYMPAEIVLGSIGYDEAFHGNNKYNEDTLKYAKMSIADLEAGKPFTLGTATRYGLSLKDTYNFEYSSKEDALGWLNLYVGYITQVGQKNKKDAQPYLYKATQITSTSKTPANQNPIPYEMIGNYYFDELNKLTNEIKVLADSQKDTDTPEVAKQKVDEIEAKVALANGYAERAMDAFARAYSFGVAKAYKDLMYKNLQDAFKVRYGKTDLLNEKWVADTVKKPLPNPTTPVTPIADPKPVTTTTTTGAAPATTPGPPKLPVTTPVNNNVKPPAKPNGTTPAKPAGTAPAKPVTKRQAALNRPASKKRA
jgi:hypothetical protein